MQGLFKKHKEIKKYAIGQIIEKTNNLLIRCGDYFLKINKLQIEGKKEMSAQEFLNGHSDILNTILI